MNPLYKLDQQVYFKADQINHPSIGISGYGKIIEVNNTNDEFIYKIKCFLPKDNQNNDIVFEVSENKLILNDKVPRF